MGLRGDGTVVGINAAGDLTSSWRDIVAIQMLHQSHWVNEELCIVGVRANGRVICSCYATQTSPRKGLFGKASPLPPLIMKDRILDWKVF